MIEQITPLILTSNEAANIERVLQRLTWASSIVVLDSFSVDETSSICAAFPHVKLIQREFDSHAVQWNYGVAQVKTKWVLALDADYVLSEELIDELKTMPESDFVAWIARFRYCIGGRPLRGSLYPPKAVLFRKDRCSYYQDGHTQWLKINGPTASLNGVIDHDDRKPLSRWLVAQDKYASLEVKKLLTTNRSLLRVQDRLRLWILPAPFFVLFYTFFFKGALFDGWPGWIYTLQRVTAEMILSMHLLEAKIKKCPPEQC